MSRPGAIALLLAALLACPAHGTEGRKPSRRCLRFLRFVSHAEYRRLYDAVPAHIEIREIREDEPVRVDAPVQCATGAINTCLAVAVIDVRARRGRLLHHMGGESTAMLRDFLDASLRGAQSPRDLRFALVGNLHADEISARLPEDIVDLLLRRGVRRDAIALELGARGFRDGSYSVRIDPRTRRIFVTFEPDED